MGHKISTLISNQLHATLFVCLCIQVDRNFDSFTSRAKLVNRKIVNCPFFIKLFSVSNPTKMARKCRNDPDSFCFICGQFITVKQKRKLTSFIKLCYELYFKRKLIHQDKEWVPHVCCSTCARLLSAWFKGMIFSLL